MEVLSGGRVERIESAGPATAMAFCCRKKKGTAEYCNVASIAWDDSIKTTYENARGVVVSAEERLRS